MLNYMTISLFLQALAGGLDTCTVYVYVTHAATTHTDEHAFTEITLHVLWML